LGGILFGWKYNDYFRDGARSLTVGRFGYWRAAVENVQSHPWTGSGPGTFMRVFQKIKRPEDEMARLVHNDYLQQATDSGLPAAIFYIVLVFGTLWSARGFLIRPQGATYPGEFSSYLCASWIGTAGWSLQSFMEWTLYVPAISWLAFLLLGLLAGSLKLEKYKTKSQLP
jgi:O-antigen ligase